MGNMPDCLKKLNLEHLAYQGISPPSPRMFYANLILDTARPNHYKYKFVDAGWSSMVARRAHNPKVIGSNPVPATKDFKGLR